MVARVTVGSKYQFAVPSAVRRKLNIERVDVLLVEMHDGHIVLILEPGDHAARLRGLHRELWQNVDPEDYFRSEREA